MARAGRAGVQIAFFGRGMAVVAATGFFDGPDAGCQGFEDRVQVVKSRFIAANHHAVATLQPPHAAAGADVDVADALGRHGLRAAHVVLEIGVAAVDDGVASFKERAQLGHCGFGDRACGQHDPDRAGFGHLADHVRHVTAAGSAFACQLLHAFGIGVIDHALVAAAHQAPHDVAAHAAQSDHSELHSYSLNMCPTKRPI